MLPQPFSVQPPEAIAKEYGGDKAKIADAAQRGMLDPTAAVLAGMFIDRMRSAATQEQAPTSTVADKVLGGASPVGLATLNQAQQAAPAPQSYAKGGLVSFASGGSVPGFNDFYNTIVNQESGGRYGIPNAQGSGAMGLGQLMPATARSLAARLGIPYNEALLKGNSPEAQAYQDKLTQAAAQEAWNYGKGDPAKAAAYYYAGPDQSKWGPLTAKYVAKATSSMGAPNSLGDSVASAGLASLPPPPDSSVLYQPNQIPSSIYGFSGDPTQNAALYNQMYQPDTTRRKELEAEITNETSPEERKKQKAQDLWGTIAEIGFGMAASKNPTILGALGESASAALPKFQAKLEKRQDEYKQAVRDLASIEGMNNADKKAAADFAWDAVSKYGTFAEAASNRDMNERMADFNSQTQRFIAGLGYKQSTDVAEINKEAQVGAAETNIKPFIQANQYGDFYQKAYTDTLNRMQTGSSAESLSWQNLNREIQKEQSKKNPDQDTLGKLTQQRDGIFNTELTKILGPGMVPPTGSGQAPLALPTSGGPLGVQAAQQNSLIKSITPYKGQ